MNRRIVAACAVFARDHGLPIVLVASRRQVERKELGGGYVEGWDAATLAREVSVLDPEGWLYLGRDHAGPWQHPADPPELAAATTSALASLREDLIAGFDLVHLDPAIAPENDRGLPAYLDRLERLHTGYAALCRELGVHPLLELGPEDRDVPVGSVSWYKTLLELAATRMPADLVVGHAGLLVQGRGNLFRRLLPHREALLTEVLGLAQTAGLSSKLHNADYLPTTVLRLLAARGCTAVNIGPSLVTAQTETWLELCLTSGRVDLAEALIEGVQTSAYWKKWIVPGTRPSPRDKAVLAAHYLQQDPRVIALDEELEDVLRRAGLDLEAELARPVEAELLRLAQSLGWLRRPLSARSRRASTP